MLYAFLCYNNEDAIFSLSQAEDDEVMSALRAVQVPLRQAGRLGPSARLMPTTAATTLRQDSDPPLVLDGPYAETKEQLLGFYVIECEDLEAALAVAKDLARANPGGAYEVRPLRFFSPGALST
ncbi:MAG TPA: YciI family protein [Caulobacteraceae bacterium]|nr:YciI family protein [Caulobacteraceae bacterium]